MSIFLEGILACMAFLGGLCGFIYWVFGLMEKRLETKIDTMAADVHRIANELREERHSRDALYRFVLDHYKTETSVKERKAK